MSESSDDSSVPPLEYGFENDDEDSIRDLIPVGRGPFPSDEFSYHETSNVSSSATSDASSSSSDPSLRGVNGSPTDSIRFLGIDTFHEQLCLHMAEHAGTWTHDYEVYAHSSTDCHLTCHAADDPLWHLDDESDDDSDSSDESDNYTESWDWAIAHPSGLVYSGRWPTPSDTFLLHEISSVLSSDSNCASFSSSEPSLRGDDGLPTTSVIFEATEDDYDRLRLHERHSAETWTHDHTVDAHFSATLSGLIPCTEDLPWCTSPLPMTVRQTRTNDGSHTCIPIDDSDEIVAPQSEWSPHWPQSEWSPHWIMHDSPETSMIQCERKPFSTEPWIPSEYLDWIPSELDDHSDYTSSIIYHEFGENPIDYRAPIDYLATPTSLHHKWDKKAHKWRYKAFHDAPGEITIKEPKKETRAVLE